MKLLLTNDDGIDAAGLDALWNVAEQLGDPVMVAPADALSGCSHRVTVDQPIRFVQRSQRRYVVEGTPADCVRVALHRIVPDAAWVLSGINAGANLGADVYHSGTVAAVREAVLHGWPGIALSHYHKKERLIDWSLAVSWAIPLVRGLLTAPWTPGTFWNINFPHIEPGPESPETVFCPLDPTPLPLSFRQAGDWLHYDGDYHQRRREPGCDVDQCFNGKIAVTQISLLPAAASPSPIRFA
jgi:5'-nucleotidase